MLSFRAQGATMAPSGKLAGNSVRVSEQDLEGGVKGHAQRDEQGYWLDSATGKPMGLTVS
jgi:hypothetical protein